RLAEMEAMLDDIKSQVKSVAGIVTVYSTWRSDGQGVTTAIYENQAAAEAATERAHEIWGSLAELLTAPPSAEMYENVEHLSG
ncbi:MAG: hypothetical protein ACR2PM_11180, partial [Hyphomicrobiales bacterium]